MDKVYSKVPAKVSPWVNFWFRPITLELTPYQKKVFKEVHDFWNQEIYVEKGIVKLRPNRFSQVEEIEEEGPEFKVNL